MTYEEQYREKMIKEVPDGYYQIGNTPWICGTGKLGMIEFDIALIKKAAEYCKEDPEEWFKKRVNENIKEIVPQT